MVKTTSYKIFKQGSKTFFIASLFFPASVKSAVFDLYAFVRTFDDYVDSVPSDEESYKNLKQLYYSELNDSKPSNLEVITNFISVQNKYKFEQSWIDSFFASMEMDLSPKIYSTMQDTENYIYGSAEVIGLMVAKIMGLDSSSYEYAKLLGKAFQYMNMIRDVNEDISFGRMYFPQSELNKYGLTELNEPAAKDHAIEFNNFITAQIEYYNLWRDSAKLGFSKIPYRYRIPINIALDLFDDTIHQISKSPVKIFSYKITPSKLKIVTTVIKRLIIS